MMEKNKKMVPYNQPKTAYQLHKAEGGNIVSFTKLVGSIMVTILLLVYAGSGVGHAIGFEHQAKSYSDLVVDFAFIAGIVWVVKKVCDGLDR